MMAAILNSTMLDSDTAILNSDTLLSSLRFTQKHSHSILTLTQTNSIWLKVIHSHLTWWWQPSCILPSWILTSWILPFCSKLWLQLIQSDSKSFILTQLDDGSHLGFSHFAQQKLHSFILTQLDDGSHIEFCHIGFSHFAQKNFTHSFWLNLMMAAILNSANLNSTILDSTILDFPLKLTHTCQDWFRHCQFPTFAQKNFTHSFWLNLMMAAILKSAILNSASSKNTSLIHSDSTWWWHKKHLQKKNFTHSFWLNLMMAAILNSSWICIISDDGTQKHSSLDSAILHKKSTSLIHSDSTWWWQPSWILPCWIQTLPSWIQTPCYLLSDSLKNTLHSILTLTQTNSIWLKLIHSELNLMMAAILNHVDSDTAILDSDTLLSSLRFTQKHSSLHSDSDSN